MLTVMTVGVRLCLVGVGGAHGWSNQRVQELLSIMPSGGPGRMGTADGLGGRTPAVGRFLVSVGEGR